MFILYHIVYPIFWHPYEKNWQCLWCNKVFQGINATKALSRVLGKEGMHIKSCYVPKDKYNITRYQELHNFKQDRKCVLLDYSEKMKAYISSLQNKSYAAIKSTIHISSKSITSSNDTNSSEMSGFSYASNITTKSNSRSLQMVHLFLILMAIQKNNHFQRDSSYCCHSRYYYLRRHFL